MLGWMETGLRSAAANNYRKTRSDGLLRDDALGNPSFCIKNEDESWILLQLTMKKTYGNI